MFAVIVPTYQKRASLKALLKSLELQTFKKFIVIIVNNNEEQIDSVDFLNSIVRPFKGLEIYILNAGKNLGPGGGRNFACHSDHVKSSQYFAFIDDDCEAAPNWLEVANSYFLKNPKSKVIFGTVTSNIKPFPPFIHGFDMKGGVFGSGNCVIEKEFFQKINGFDTYLNNWAEDFEFGERCSKENEKPVYVPSLVVNHPPKLINYNLTKHIIQPAFYKKYLYLIKVKKYEYKSNFRRDHLKRGLIRFIFFLPLFFLGFFCWCLFFAPFLLHLVIQLKKAPKFLDILQSYPFENKLNYIGLLKFLLFHWVCDIINFFLILIYSTPFIEGRMVKSIRKTLSY